MISASRLIPNDASAPSDSACGSHQTTSYASSPSPNRWTPGCTVAFVNGSSSGLRNTESFLNGG